MDQVPTDKHRFFDSMMMISTVMEEMLNSYVTVSAGQAIGGLVNVLSSTLSKNGIKPMN